MKYMTYLDSSDACLPEITNSGIYMFFLNFEDNSALETVITPTNVTKFNEGVFNIKPNLKHLIILSTTPPTIETSGSTYTSMFTNNSWAPQLHIYVPNDSVKTAYLTDS